MCETTSSARPRALISRSALASAARLAVQDGGTLADLRRDAWGHGLLAVAQAVSAAGAARVLVDTPEEVSVLALEGIDAVVDGDPDISSTLLYGLPDAAGDLHARPVMRLVGRVLSTKPLRAGDAVSYGYTHRASVDTTVALVTGGYAQGVVRALGNRARVEIGGVAHPIVGRVAMDVCVVDLESGALPPSDLPLGAEATYFGGDGPVAPALARWAEVTGLSIGELIAVAGSHAERGWEG